MTTGDHTHRTAHGPRTASVRLDVANTTGDLWCATCKALSGFTADVVLAHPDGVTVVGSVTGCVICTPDPDSGPRPKEA